MRCFGCSALFHLILEKFKMNKFAVLLLLVICAAWTADAQRRGNRRNSGGGRMRVIEEVESISETNRGGKRRMQQSVNLQEIVENAEISNPLGRRRNARFEEQVFFPTTGLPPVGLQRRGNEFLGAQRAFERKNRRGTGRGAAAGSSLKAGERHLDAIQALLQKKQARQEVGCIPVFKYLFSVEVLCHSSQKLRLQYNENMCFFLNLPLGGWPRCFVALL